MAHASLDSLYRYTSQPIGWRRRARSRKPYHARWSTLPRRALNRVSNVVMDITAPMRERETAPSQASGAEFGTPERMQIAGMAVASGAALAAINALGEVRIGQYPDFAGLQEKFLWLMSQPGPNQLLPLGLVMAALSIYSASREAQQAPVPLRERAGRPVSADSW